MSDTKIKIKLDYLAVLSHTSIGGGGLDWASDIFFCHGRTETWLLKSRLAAYERRD